MKVKLLAHTPEPEKVCALAMRGCRLRNAPVEEDLTKPVEYYIKLAKRLGHTSVLEHANATFNIEGISRVTSHQLVRHRIASYSQQSQRVVKPTNTQDWYVTPPSIAKVDAYRYHSGMQKIKEYYEKFLQLGIPIEDARYFLPNATKTNITMTMNARSLLNFFNLRLSEHAQWETRIMARLMLEEVKKVAPTIFEGI